jgi:hypothetical protein
MTSRKSAKKIPKMFSVSQERAEEGRIGTMGRAEDMRRLGEDTINSFDARVATRAAVRQSVAAMRHETAGKLNGFRQELKNVRHELRRKAADLKRFLGNAAASRMRDFRAMHQSIRDCLEAVRARQEERSREVAGMMSDFRREREAAAGHWQNMAATMLKRRASATR